MTRFFPVIDDGSTVTIDLHGLTVDAAEDAAIRLIDLAVRRGRTSVKLVHGSSTTDRDGYNRTIKTAISDLTSNGQFGKFTKYVSDNYVILGLPMSANVDGRRITSLDVF